jgi:hypothetical protein
MKNQKDPGTGGDIFSTSAGDRTGRTSRTTTPHTPIDSVRASLIAGEAIEPAYAYPKYRN